MQRCWCISGREPDVIAPEDQSLLGLVGVSFKIIAEKATAYEMMEEAEQEEQLNQDKTIGFYRN